MPLIPAINRSTSNDAVFTLLTITPTDGGTVLRCVNNMEAIVSRGMTFEAYPFSVSLPGDSGDTQPSVSITIDAVDQRIIELVRELLEPPSVKLEVVLSSSPNTVDKSIDFLRLSNVQYNALQVTGTLQPVNFLSMPAVDSIYSGVEFPDLVWR